MHRVYARKAQVVVPPLSAYESQQVTDLSREIRFPGPVVLTNPASIELPPTATVANL